MVEGDKPLAAYACATSGNPFSDGVVLLAYGETSDGSIVHIDNVPSGLECACVCPACRTRLVARKGLLVQHHFAHLSAIACRHAAETAIHKLAKQILDERRRLMVPEVRAEVGGHVFVGYRERAYDLDDAILERRLGDIVPDVIVRKGTHELLVEIAVTHRCGEEKKARIRSLGIAAIEIDLSDLPRNATPAMVEDAILRSAQRVWLFNPKEADVKARLRTRIANAEAAKRAEIERQSRKLVDLNERALARQSELRADYSADAVRQVMDIGYGSVIDLPIPGDHCFRVGRANWQGAIFAKLIVPLIREWGGGHRSFKTTDAFDCVKQAGFLHPGLDGFVDENMESFLHQQIPGYQNPFLVVEGYLGELAKARILSGYRKRWSI